MKKYRIVFNYLGETKNTYRVQKKTKKINKVFYIPKSICIILSKYEQEKSLWKDVKYTRERIELELPEDYVKKELGFYK